MTTSLHAHRWPIALLGFLLSSFEIFGDIKLNGVLGAVSLLVFYIAAVSLMGLIWSEGRAVPILKFIRLPIVLLVALTLPAGSLSSFIDGMGTVRQEVDCGQHRRCLVIGRGAFGGTWEDVVQRRLYLWVFHIDKHLLQFDRERVLQMQYLPQPDDLVLRVQEYGKPAREVNHRLNAQ